MKAWTILAVAVVAATGVASTPAAAERYHERTVQRHSSHYEHRDNGWRDRKWRWRTSCHTQWRNGHREKVCRRIRYR